ncbi:ChaN family lipoprotein [Pseudodesulfovibrio sp. zrk46]|uniref:ChaN family lipoprotein n=1 Tax=Pseudodesulfovibrio sp. zrk46 TaxID=2725288 RepID=UPI001449951E|nr:ChaN family lipoprotein [Pseudodesulfovibrio sp. zrk46]QJB56084.1 PDZ domain-containing protein [Pseudodesulfovibrio sp. zrk46]
MKYKTTRTVLRKGPVLLLLALTLTLGACVKTIQHPRMDVTFLPDKGDFISKYGDQLSIDEITAMAKGKDYILIGEGHRNPVDHSVQQQLLAALAATETPPSVGLEMIAVDMQPVLNDFGKGQVEVDALEEELEWSERWGFSYSLFRGLFEITQRNSLPVAGLNVPTRITRKISKEGIESLTDEERAFLPNEIVPPANAQVPLLDSILSQHKGKDKDDATQRERFHLVQSIWDSKMAEEAVRLRKEFDWPVMVIAGGGHVEYAWGIARRIRRHDPAAKILTIMPWRGGEFDDEVADVFFYSPDTYVSRMGATLTAQPAGGLLVERVERGSRAEKAGLRPGDVLLEASGIRLDHLFSLHIAGAKVHKEDKELTFLVQRGEDTYSTSVGKLGKRPSSSKKMKKSETMPTKASEAETKTDKEQ